MAQFAHSSRATVVGTTLRSMCSLYATTGIRPRVREVGVTNTTGTAVAVALARFTTATNVGTGLTEAKVSDTAQAAVATVFAGHTGDGGAGEEIRRTVLGAAAGSTIIWTFAEPGLVIPNTTADGIGLICPTGTGQICDIWYGWDE